MTPPVLQTSAITNSSAAGILECMRPVQWIKNTFVLAPLVFSVNLAVPGLVLKACLIFAAFCLAASGVYLLNDSIDWRSDLSHPEKRRRPIPSGRLSPALAAACGSVLLAMAVAVGFLANAPAGLFVCGYVLLNSLYSFRLKHVTIVDLMCIAIGFVLRVMAGAAAIEVQASHWLLMCTFLVALFLAIAKRRQELVTLAAGSGAHRRVLTSYSLPWLDQAATLVSGSAVVAYALYAFSPETQAKFGTDKLMYTVPFVVFGILRYLHLVHASDRTGNPTSALLIDKQLLGCVVGWVVACAMIIYF
jgi:4-hydroxybenzoate polyprenyltransferase